jgi:HAD superfamily hydrolase (TIGR01509 family)
MRHGVIFDLDGTLVDTNYLHVVAWGEAFRHLGHDIPMVAVHGAIGRADRALIDYLLPSAGDEKAQAISVEHAALYKSRLDEVRPVRGAGELMRKLSDAGLRVVVSTSAHKDVAERLIGVTGAEDTVSAVVHAQDVERSKPDPEPVRDALGKAGLSADQAIFIGDTVWDVLAARGAGVECVALRSGGIDTASLMDAGARVVYKDCDEVLHHLDDGPLARLLTG